MSQLTEDEKAIIDPKSEGLMAAIALMIEVMYEGQLSAAELVQFCRVTPNGEKLWLQFQNYRDRSSEQGKDDYGYVDFAREVLRENPPPQALQDVAAILAARDVT